MKKPLVVSLGVVFLLVCAAGIGLVVLFTSPFDKPAPTAEQLIEHFANWRSQDKIGELYRIGRQTTHRDDPTIDLLIDVLLNGTAKQREAALNILNGLGSMAERAVPMVVSAIDDENEWVGSTAILAIVNIEPDATPVEKLAGFVGSDQLMLSYSATIALGDLGADAVEGVSALIAALSNEDSEIRFASALSLGKIARKPELTIPALLTLAGDSDPRVPVVAINSVAAFGSQATPYLRNIREFSKAVEGNHPKAFEHAELFIVEIDGP